MHCDWRRGRAAAGAAGQVPATTVAAVAGLLTSPATEGGGALGLWMYNMLQRGGDCVADGAGSLLREAAGAAGWLTASGGGSGGSCGRWAVDISSDV